jgi:hypothetical protein
VTALAEALAALFRPHVVAEPAVELEHCPRCGREREVGAVDDCALLACAPGYWCEDY